MRRLRLAILRCLWLTLFLSVQASRGPKWRGLRNPLHSSRLQATKPRGQERRVDVRARISTNVDFSDTLRSLRRHRRIRLKTRQTHPVTLQGEVHQQEIL